MALGRGSSEARPPQAGAGQPGAQSSAGLRAALTEALGLLDSGQPALAAAELVFNACGSTGLRPGPGAKAPGDAEGELGRRNEQLLLLSGIARLLSSVETPEQLFDVLLTELLEPLELVNLEFYFLDAADGRLYRRLHRASDPALDPGPDVLDPAQGVVGRCMRTHHEQVVNDTRLDPDFFDPVPGSVRSQAAFPLFVSSRLVGVMNLECAQAEQFSADRLELLRSLVPQVAIVVERLRLIAGLREQERMLANAFDNIPGMYYRCLNDPQWSLELVSDNCLALTGYTREELLSGSVTFGGQVILAADRERVWEEVQLALAEGRRYVLDYRIASRAGEIKHVWEQGGGVWNAAGELLALEGVILDVSPQREALDALAAAEQRYRELFETMGEGLVIVDHANGSRFSVANPAAEALFGVPPGALVGRKLSDFCDAEGKRILDGKLIERRRGLVGRYEMTVVREDGARRRIKVTASPRYDASGAVVGSFSLIEDVGEAGGGGAGCSAN